MPVSVIKVRFESNLYNYKYTMDAVRSIYKSEGWTGFFAGYGATALRDAPYAGLYLFFYEHFKRISYRLLTGRKDLQKENLGTGSGLYVNAVSGMGAGLLATSIVHPFDVLKTKIQLAPSEYKNMIHAVRLVFKVGLLVL